MFSLPHPLLRAVGATAALTTLLPAGVPTARAQAGRSPEADVPADTFARLPLATAADLDAYVGLHRALQDRDVGPDATSIRRALALAEALDRPADRGLLLRRVLRDAYVAGGPDAAGVDSLHAALAAVVPRMRPEDRAGAYNLLGGIASDREANVAEVLTYFRAAAEAAVGVDPVTYHYATDNLARVYFALGDTAAAAERLHRSIALAPPLDSLAGDGTAAYSRALSYAWLSGIHRDRGALDSAAYFLRRAEAERERLRGSPRYDLTRPTVFAHRALLRTALGRYGEAAADIDTLRAYGVAEAAAIEAEWFAAQERYPEAIATLRRSPPPVGRRGARFYHENLWRYTAAAGETRAALAEATETIERYRADLTAARLDLAAATDAQRRSFEAERRATTERHAQEVAAYQARLRTYGSLGVGTVCLLVATYWWRRHRRARRHSADLSQLVSERDRDLGIANAQLARRVEAMERFNHLLSHDLREPVRSISGFTTLLRRKTRDDARLAEDVGYLASAVGQLEHLLARVEALRRVEERTVGRDVATVRRRCEQSVRQLRGRYPDLAVETAIAAAAAEQPITTELVGIALGELLDNAARFSPGPGAAIGLRVDYDEAADTCAFTIRDGGVGIPAEYHERIFEAFSRLHRREEYPGAGIGLTLARNAAQRAGGHVALVRSVEGEGSVFRLVVPVRRESR